MSGRKPERRRDPLLRGAYRLAYRLLQLYGPVRRRPSRGVQCLLTHRGTVLLVRHTYGSRRVWRLPGGGQRAREDAPAAARREMQEELGLSGLVLAQLSTLEMRLERRPVRLTVLHAELPGPELHPDPIEIAEARWFAAHELPTPLAREVRLLLRLLPATAAGTVSAGG